MKNLLPIIRWTAIIIVACAVTVIVYLVTNQKSCLPQEDMQAEVEIDQTAIVQALRELDRLETIEAIYQRNVDIVIDAGDLEVFGVTLAEKKRTQKIIVVGSVIAGIDLSKITPDDVVVSDDGAAVGIQLPPAEILSTFIDPDKTIVTKDNATVLFKIDTLRDEKRAELDEFLFDSVQRQGQIALKDAACSDNLLIRASENAQKSFFVTLPNIISGTTVTLRSTPAEQCQVSL